MKQAMRWPLMQENITHDDLTLVAGFLMCGDIPPRGLPWTNWAPAKPSPRLTQGPQVSAFEQEFAQWLGVKYAVMVNSGASANLLTMAAMRELQGFQGIGEIIVPAITWSSDIASVLHTGMTPVFVDVDPRTMGLDWDAAGRAVTDKTMAVFPTHCLGFNAGVYKLHYKNGHEIPVIEDCCEAIGAVQSEIRLGSRSLASNFSFYYGHHMTTIEGGMICTNDEAMYETCRVLRSHGMIREIASPETRKAYENDNPQCWPEFTFEHAGYNVRPTEINAVIGRSQLKRLDDNVEKRSENLLLFLSLLDSDLYRTDYRTVGSSSFALPIILNEPDDLLMNRILTLLQAEGVEYRRGTAGGGNQLRQPYLRKRFAGDCRYNPLAFPNAEHIHEYGLYIGNYPNLDHALIYDLCEKLNRLAFVPLPKRNIQLMDEGCSTQTLV